MTKPVTVYVACCIVTQQGYHFTPEQQLRLTGADFEADALVYGCKVVKVREDGTLVRINPAAVEFKP